MSIGLQIRRIVNDMQQALRLFGVNEWRLFEEGETKVVVAWSAMAVLVVVRGSYSPANFAADANVRSCFCLRCMPN